MDSKDMDKSIVCGFFWPTLYITTDVNDDHDGDDNDKR